MDCRCKGWSMVHITHGRCLKVPVSGIKHAGRRLLIGAVIAAFGNLAAFVSIDAANADSSTLPASQVDMSGTVHLQPLDVPFSTFASIESQRAFVSQATGPRQVPPAGADIKTLREFYDKYNVALAARAKELYPVDIKPQVIGGVRTEVITPKGGVAKKNQNRVLINLHGGAFLWGEGAGGEEESVPIASIGQITVITVAYRQGPEFKFPAASEDVAAVYQELLRTYDPANVGIYGCSAGGILTAESIAWLQKRKLPRPGAIGTFCGSASGFGGDSVYVAFPLAAQPPLAGARTGELSFSPYFSEAPIADPLVLPINSSDVLAKFPPTLLIAGSRDFAVSSLFHTQAALTNLGVETELHIWDGMWHAFFIDPDIPESKEVYRVIVNFFDRHLGRR
jgi:monoterpene epsilon-lactone hydrolase